MNLKACNHFRLYNGKAAEAELKVLADLGHTLQANDLIRHNMVVFQQGEGALQVLPQLVDYIPEARLNLVRARLSCRRARATRRNVKTGRRPVQRAPQVIYYLRHDGIQEAYELIKDLEPSTPQEYILKGSSPLKRERATKRVNNSSCARSGVVNASVGQALGSREHIKMAQQFFQARLHARVEFCCNTSRPFCSSAVRFAPACRRVGQRVRHHPWAPVHGVVLLPLEAV